MTEKKKAMNFSRKVQSKKPYQNIKKPMNYQKKNYQRQIKSVIIILKVPNYLPYINNFVRIYLYVISNQKNMKKVLYWIKK